MMTGLYEVYERNQTHFQVGDNTNLFDWTYITNAAHAHLLAADRLIPMSPDQVETVKQELKYALPYISCTTGSKRLPTSESRPLGPYVTPPPNAEQITANWDNPHHQSAQRPAIRGRFDPLSETALEREDDASLQVAGQVFFITNGEPLYFWDVPRVAWRFFDEHFATNKTQRRTFHLSKEVGMVLASAAEWWAWLVGKHPGFTRFRVTFSCVWRCHNIERARRVLGYEPQVGMEEGLRKTLEVCDQFYLCKWMSYHYHSGSLRIRKNLQKREETSSFAFTLDVRQSSWLVTLLCSCCIIHFPCHIHRHDGQCSHCVQVDSKCKNLYVIHESKAR